jgi:hypothetical protein
MVWCELFLPSFLSSLVPNLGLLRLLINANKSTSYQSTKEANAMHVTFKCIDTRQKRLTALEQRAKEAVLYQQPCWNDR